MKFQRYYFFFPPSLPFLPPSLCRASEKKVCDGCFVTLCSSRKHNFSLEKFSSFRGGLFIFKKYNLILMSVYYIYMYFFLHFVYSYVWLIEKLLYYYSQS